MAEKQTTIMQERAVAALNAVADSAGSSSSSSSSTVGDEEGSTSLIKLNKCNKANSYIPFDNLNIGVPYKIHRFGTFSTKKKKNQVRLTAFIDDGYLILPERFDCLVPEAETINAEQMFIIYNGRGENNRFLNIEFIEM